ncbi:hypothetical protein [Bacillus sp. ISL-37]|uniref:hypothetical protein n=1 Tax=Bacillus sp. ISL-37 TaxID=2819123 RepID=UPI001BE83E23|nr:hypothetical protein [Bacillus sp. ISL-37]MBT2686320.1 hypothetical protein [Bacillus sp. ISL-37]
MKRLRSFLVFFIPFIVFFFYFTSNNEHNPSSANASKKHMGHGLVEIPEEYQIPTVDVSVTQDPAGTWLLKVKAENFMFTPEKVGEETPSYNEGHAHLYINGKKINRLYGEYYNLGDLKKGKNEIMVTLNSNNHGILAYRGKAIISNVVVENGK